MENPPTKKKIGMTWRNQVASHIQGVTPMALLLRIRPWSQANIPIVQWPITTARMLDRAQEVDVAVSSAGVFAASASSEAIDPV